MADTNGNRRRADWLIGLAVYGATIGGVAALLLAVFSVFSGRLEAAASCLISASIAFGALANAVLRT